VAPEGAITTIRIAALKCESGEIEVALRSQETGFQVDHFRATCHFKDLSGILRENLTDLTPAQFPPLMLDPHQELYEKHFFHKGRFRRVQSYRQMTARAMVAELSPIDQEPWFSRYLPSDLVLGDPGARDATIHAIQVCVPQATLLPISVEQIVPGVAKTDGPRYVQACERVAAAEADMLVFDVEVVDSAGEVQEVWQGLRLKLMSGTTFAGSWSPSLLGPYLERRLRDHLPEAGMTIVVQRNAEGDRRTHSDLAIQRALGEIIPVTRRSDGKPEVATNRVVSVAHAGDLTLAVAAPQTQGALGCDMERVIVRSETIWQDLLGERFELAYVMVQAAKEDLHTAATRVWAAGECLKKAGAALDAPLTLASAHEDGWVLLSAGAHVIATYLAQIQTSQEPIVLAVLVRRDHATLL
jgi:enediyne polyketide synthase